MEFLVGNSSFYLRRLSLMVTKITFFYLFLRGYIYCFFFSVRTVFNKQNTFIRLPNIHNIHTNSSMIEIYTSIFV